tara:strand:- start:199 stop:504 length:306 start_codon:yes stop_codon:yes gene_type:complete
MTEFKGTKGKWTVDKYSYEKGVDMNLPIKSDIKNRGWIADSKGNHVNIGMTTEEMEANALLISKAPEMLEMLDKLIPILKENSRFSLLDELKQLIKEATEL